MTSNKDLTLKTIWKFLVSLTTSKTKETISFIMIKLGKLKMTSTMILRVSKM